MSNRVEYSFLFLSMVVLGSVYILYDPSESIKEHHLPSTTAIDSLPSAHPEQATPPGQATSFYPSGSPDTQASANARQATPLGQANSISPFDPPDAQAAVNERAHGLNEIGLMYLNGKGVARNLEAAFEFFNLAAQ